MNKLVNRAALRRAASTAAAPPARLRVLVASHGHPELNKGGAEVASYALYQALSETCDAWYLGCDRGALPARAGPCITQPFPRDHEYIYACGPYDWFRFANRDPAFARDFAELLAELRPDVLHMHHYLNFGVEAFLIARRVLPGIRVVLTLHEYLLICHHLGQMVKNPTLALCHAASPAACHGCFPDISQQQFHLRTRYLMRFLEEVDAFIAPSHFLAGRYIAWGLPADRISVIPNVKRPASLPPAPRPARAPGSPLRVGFFGQISPLKGILVLLDAAALLERSGAPVAFDIHGTDEGQLPQFRAAFSEKLAKAGPNVCYHGPYDQDHVDELMQGVDVVVLPSIWWENAPTVIAEAKRNHRPVICSDIGGMAEAVTDGVDGWLFPVGSAAGLHTRLLACVGEKDFFLRRTGFSLSHQSCASATLHQTIYRSLQVPARDGSVAMADTALSKVSRTKALLLNQRSANI